MFDKQTTGGRIRLPVVSVKDKNQQSRSFAQTTDKPHKRRNFPNNFSQS